MNNPFYPGFQNIISRNNNRFTKRKHSNPDPFKSYKSPSQHKSNSLTIGQFILGKTIGKGTFGKVKLGTHMITGEKAAIKILEKVKLLDETDQSRMSREIQILKSTFHHNIIRIYSVIETKKQIYLLTEYAEGGELFNYIVRKRKLYEYEACKFFHQIIDALDYIHKLGICHRDLKPENMLLDHKGNLKIADFGLSNLYLNGELLSTACGSPGYAAPEMLRGERYDGLLSDIWSCGVILFAMLCGYLPFDDNDDNALYEKIIIGKYIMPNGLSSMAKDIISKILVTDPNRRLTINQIRDHPWYNTTYCMQRVNGLFISVHPIPIDIYVVKAMKFYGYNEDEVKEMLIANKHNNATTLYYMIIKKNMNKGIPSISDLISKQFMQYIQSNNIDPEHLILTKVNSSIYIENNVCTGNNSISPQKLKCLLYQTDDDIINNNNDEDNNIQNRITINNNCNCNSSTDKTNNFNFDDIIVMNEKIETFGNVEPRIMRFKGMKRLKHFGAIKNEIPLITQLKSQYDKYVINSQVRNQQTHYIKGFLQTSMSFHKNDHNNHKHRHYHHSSTLDNNVSTTPSNNNSKSPTPKNKNVYLNQKMNKFQIVNKGKKNKCFSQPKRDKERKKQHLSSNARSTDNSSKRKNSFKKKIIFTHKNKQLINSNQNKLLLIKKFRFNHCKTPPFDSRNQSTNKSNNNNIFVNKKTLYKNNNNDLINRGKSMENNKAHHKNALSSTKRKTNNNIIVMTNNNHRHNKSNLVSYQKISCYKSIHYSSKIDNRRPISEPKKAKQFYQSKYFPKKKNNVQNTHKRVHSRTIAISLVNKKCKTIINKIERKSHDNKYFNNNILYKVNRTTSTEEYSNNNILINSSKNKKKQLFNYSKKVHAINLSSIQTKLLNRTNSLRYSSKKPKNNRSKSTCSTPNKDTQSKCDKNWIFDKSLKQANEIMQLSLPVKNINVTPIIVSKYYITNCCNRIQKISIYAKTVQLHSLLN